ncbi:MAG: HAD-IA family hydrolase, partial [Verrucomicrobiota bacterium]|nr:HAD-IA family hydrolase [Verrucomicrobiota bacterium]
SWTVDSLVDLWSSMFSINETGRGLFLDAVAAGIPVHILSNIGGHHIDAIKNNWSGFFDGAAGLFLSYQIGFRKPDPSIYHHVLDHLNAEGPQCFFLDDRPENVEAARAEGINAYHFVPENHAAIRRAATEFFDLP